MANEILAEGDMIMDTEENEIDEFHTKVVGVTFGERQKYIRDMQIGERIILEREPDNTYDKNAIKVINSKGFQIGFISKDLAAQLAPKLDNGLKLSAVCSDITGGCVGYSYGVTIKIFEEENAYIIKNSDENNYDICENNQLKKVMSHENNIVVCIMNFFEHYNLEYEFDSENTVFFIDMPLDGVLKSVSIIINVFEDKCLCRSYINLNVEENLKTQIAEYITRINFIILDGKFQLNFDNGEIHFSHFMIFHKSTMSESDMNYLMLYPMDMIEKYGKGFLAIMVGMSTPEEAVNAVKEEV